jgi:hypothetical protein
MDYFFRDRRLSVRYAVRTVLRVRIWKSTSPERRAESINISESGIYFLTDSPPSAGEMIEILLKMPEEVTGEPTTEWRCTGHVVRIDKPDSRTCKLGVGVQFDCYEVSRVQESSDLVSALLARRITSRTAR